MGRKFFAEHPDLRGIPKYDRKMAERLITVYPAWENYLELEMFDAQKGWSIKVPAPVKPTNTDRQIVSERLTVYFDFHHVHFARWSNVSELVAFENARRYIDALLAEEVVILVFTDEEGRCRAGAHYPPNRIADALLEWLTDGYARGYARSWRGTYDRTYGGFEFPASEDEKLKKAK